jgi:type IV pilus assembly protein PilF
MRSLRIAAVVIVAVMGLLAGCSTTGSGDFAAPAEQSEAQKRARIRLQLAMEYYEQRQLPVALEEIRKALQADAEFSDAYSVRALIYMDLGESKLAQENFLQAIRLAPDNPDLSNNYGWFLCQNERAAQGIPYFEKALKNRAYQSPAKALVNAGMCSLKLRDFDAANRYFLRSFELDPSSPATNFHLAQLLYRRGDAGKAGFYIDRILKNDASNADVLWLGVKIKHKLGDKLGEMSLAAQLRRRYPDSNEYSAYQRGAYDE